MTRIVEALNTITKEKNYMTHENYKIHPPLKILCDHCKVDRLLWDIISPSNVAVTNPTVHYTFPALHTRVIATCSICKETHPCLHS